MPASDTASNTSKRSDPKGGAKAKKGKSKSKKGNLVEPLLEPSDPMRMQIQKAAWQLEDALQGRCQEDYPEGPMARDMHFKAGKAEHDCMIAMSLMIFLTMFETPTWCDNRSHFWKWIDPSERCVVYQDGSAVPSDNVLLANIPYIPPGYALLIEVYLLMTIGYKYVLDRNMALEFGKLSKEATDPHQLRLVNFGIAMVVFALADVGYYYAVRGPIRTAFVFRSCLFALLPAVQNLGSCVLECVGQLISTAVFLIGTIIFFAWIAVTVFISNDDPVFIMGNTTRVNEGMDSFAHTLYTMFVAGATDEFVDVLQPTYSVYRASGLLWMVFLVMVRVLLLNLVLDTLVAAYTESSEAFEEKETSEKVEGIQRAFRTLVNAGNAGEEKVEEEQVRLSKSSFVEFIKEFSLSPSVRSIKPSTASILFDCMAADENSKDVPAEALWIMEAQFCNMCAVLDYDFWTTIRDSPVRFELPFLWKSLLFRTLRKWNAKPKDYSKIRWNEVTDTNDKEQMQKVARKCPEKADGTSSFDNFMTAVLVVNLLLVLWESSYDLNNIDEPPYMAKLELVFGFLYVMEVGVKLCCISWAEYSSDRSNVFDFFTTWLLLGSSVLEEEMASLANANLKRYANILRLFRLLRVGKQLRLLKRMRQVQFMISTITQLVMASKQILTLLGVVVYFFTTLSVQLWGGLLYRENPALEGQEYQEEEYHVLNFNDFPMAFGTWVVILLCEYMPLFAEAIHATSNYKQTWWVFLIFYFTAVCIVFELVKAFTIEVFMDLKKEWDKVDVIELTFTEGDFDTSLENPIEDFIEKISDKLDEEKEKKEKDNVRELKIKSATQELLCEGEAFEFTREQLVASDFPVTVRVTVAGGDEEDNFKGLDTIRNMLAETGERLWFRANGNKTTRKKFREAVKEAKEKEEGGKNEGV